MKLKKGDLVQVVKGKDKGKTAKIEKSFSKEEKVLLEGLNQYKRHLKARSQTEPGGIVTISKPLSVANVALVCPKCKQITRIGFAQRGDSKNRICRKCKEVV